MEFLSIIESIYTTLPGHDLLSKTLLSIIYWVHGISAGFRLVFSIILYILGSAFMAHAGALLFAHIEQKGMPFSKKKEVRIVPNEKMRTASLGANLFLTPISTMLTFLPAFLANIIKRKETNVKLDEVFICYVFTFFCLFAGLIMIEDFGVVGPLANWLSRTI